MITTKKLTLNYRALRGGSILAVDHIDLEVKKNDIFGFLGPNGAGKTTTIHMLTTVLEPTEGTAEIGGYDILKDPLKAKRQLGFMPEIPSFYDWMKAVDQLKFYCKFYGFSSAEANSRSKEMIELVGLSSFGSKKIKTFSHGMRKRLALASAMIHDPDILILDEPMGGLDPVGVKAFREMIKELNRNNITIFLSSHLLSEVQQICTRVGIINQGKLLAVDTISGLSKNLDQVPLNNLYIEGKGITEKIIDLIKSNPGIVAVETSPENPNGYQIAIAENSDADSIAGEINKELAKKNVYLSRLEVIKPNLEELFMKITRGS